MKTIQLISPATVMRVAVIALVGFLLYWKLSHRKTEVARPVGDAGKVGQSLTLSVTTNDCFILQGKVLTSDQLELALREAGWPTNKVIIRSDSNIPYSSIIRALDRLHFLKDPSKIPLDAPGKSPKNRNG